VLSDAGRDRAVYVASPDRLHSSSSLRSCGGGRAQRRPATVAPAATASRAHVGVALADGAELLRSVSSAFGPEAKLHSEPLVHRPSECLITVARRVNILIRDFFSLVFMRGAIWWGPGRRLPVPTWRVDSRGSYVIRSCCPTQSQWYAFPGGGLTAAG
jgi:hypothetical protein